MADEIVEEFLVESGEGLERIERDLVTLEEDASSKDVVDRIFRDIHTIKGVSGFLGYVNLERVAHASESLLSKIRANEVAVCERVISTLLATVDAIRTMLESVEQEECDGNNEYTELVAELVALEGGSSVPQMPPSEVSETGLVFFETENEKAEQPDSMPPLGEILIEQGVAESAVHRALVTQEEGDPRRLGEILVRRNAARPKQIEEALNVQRDARQAGGGVKGATIRVNVDLLDKLMNLVGELVLVRNQILQSTLNSDDGAQSKNAQRLNLVTSELQEGVMKTRMQPIGTIWGKFPRIVRDLARSFGKEMRLEMEGRETELDKTIIEAIKDPLTHLVRNACDHGMEMPDERVAQGKPMEGLLRLRAYHEGGQVIIEVSDDGKGIDSNKIKASAIRKGLLSPAQGDRLGEREALNLIFLPGFSTAEKVTNVSGRGVGMDVVKTNIECIGGTIDVSSTLGEGTMIRVKIPLTLAIIPALIVRCDGDSYAIPQVNLLELVLLEGEEIKRVEYVNGTPVYRLRGQLLPLLFLKEQLSLGHRSLHDHNVLNIVVLQADSQRFGLVVEGVRDTEEIVVKPLGKELKGLNTYAGATIMGDGTVALILDVLGLAQVAGIAGEDGTSTTADKAGGQTDRALDEAQALLLFKSATDSPIGIELNRIDRLEVFEKSRVEHTGSRHVVQYRGRIMPVIHLSQALYGEAPVSAGQDDDENYQVVVVRRASEVFGLIVGTLVDIIDMENAIQPVGKRHGVRGSAVVQGTVVELLDVDAILRSALPEMWNESQGAEGV